MAYIPDNESSNIGGYYDEEEPILTPSELVEDESSEYSYSGPIYNVMNLGSSIVDQLIPGYVDDPDIPSGDELDPEKNYYKVVVLEYFRIKDFDPYVLEDLYNNGATFYALYDDDTTEEVAWQDISVIDQYSEVVEFDNAIANALNQHFWSDSSGVYISEQEQTIWNAAVLDNFSDLSSSKNYYNILMNSLGFLLRRALYNLVSINRAAISFYDGLGNNTTNIMASFGRSSAQIGRSEGKHVIIDNDGITAYDGDNIAPLNASNITAAEANIRQLQANTADIATIRANSAKVDNLTAASLSAATGYVADLTTANVTANNLVADHAAVSNLSTTYAQINGANINTAQIRDAWINNLLVQSGLIAHEGAIFTLDAIQVNASNITAGTIDVERLVVTQNGQKYMVHVNPSTGTPSYEKLDGNVIEDLTITADKIVAGAITAQKITTENLVGTGGWINLRNGTFSYSNVTSGQGITWDGQNLNISGSVTIGGNPILLSDVVENTLIYDHTYQFNNDHTEATFTAYLFRGGIDVKSEYQSSQFTWWYKTEDDQDPIYIDSGYTCDVSIAQMGYGGHIIGRFTSLQDANLQTSDGDNLLTSDEQEILTQTEEGGSIRISDLVVATNLRSSDKLVVSGPEGENLVTISTLQNYLETNIGKQVLFNTTNGWNTQSSLISQENKLYVYTDHATDSSGNPLAGIKVGDGNAYLIDIPFIDQLFTNHINDTSIHVTPAEKAFWNNKVSCYYAGLDTLVLTTN